MRTAKARRVTAASVAAGVALTVLVGCIPAPPPVPGSPGGTDPSGPEPGEIASGETIGTGRVSGSLGEDGTVAYTLEVAERSAVAIGAISTDDEDLMLRLHGGGIDVENDDSRGEFEVFSFEQGTLDPAVVAVLEPGSYTIEVEEWSGDATGFELEVLMGANALAPDEPVSGTVSADEPFIATATSTGNDVYVAIAPDEVKLWAVRVEAELQYEGFANGDEQHLPVGGQPGEDVVVIVELDDDSDEPQQVELRQE